MITIEQIQRLDQKVQAAVNQISTLKKENTDLQGTLDEYRKRIEELEVVIERFKKDQSEIENGIIRALEHLDHLEDSFEAPADEKVSDEAAPVVSETAEATDKTDTTDDSSSEQDENELDIF